MQPDKTDSLSEESNEANLLLLFELLNHNETNFVLFALSRITIISKLIGPELTATRIIPELIQISNKMKDREIAQQIHLILRSFEDLHPCEVHADKNDSYEQN